jgi:hypothetical protein
VQEESWTGLAAMETPQGAIEINEYFARHPEMSAEGGSTLFKPAPTQYARLCFSSLLVAIDRREANAIVSFGSIALIVASNDQPRQE